MAGGWCSQESGCVRCPGLKVRDCLFHGSMRLPTGYEILFLPIISLRDVLLICVVWKKAGRYCCSREQEENNSRISLVDFLGVGD